MQTSLQAHAGTEVASVEGNCIIHHRNIIGTQGPSSWLAGWLHCFLPLLRRLGSKWGQMCLTPHASLASGNSVHSLKCFLSLSQYWDYCLHQHSMYYLWVEIVHRSILLEAFQCYNANSHTQRYACIAVIVSWIFIDNRIRIWLNTICFTTSGSHQSCKPSTETPTIV